MKRGKLVVIEGNTGVGKTEQIALLTREPFFQGWLIAREPGGTEFGDKVRDAVQGMHGYKVNVMAELYAYAASRANLVNELVRPALAMGKNFLLDRYWFSTYVIQGSRGVPKWMILLVNYWATGGLLPDLVIQYKVTKEVALLRKSKKTDSDRLDAVQLARWEKMERSYDELRWMFPFFWRQVDATRSIEQVHQETVLLLKNLVY